MQVTARRRSADPRAARPLDARLAALLIAMLSAALWLGIFRLAAALF